MSNLPPMSRKRRTQLKRRKQVRAEVIERQDGECAMVILGVDHECGTLPDRYMLEVDEPHGGATRSSEWLDPNAVWALCPVAHELKTDGGMKSWWLDQFDRYRGVYGL